MSQYNEIKPEGIKLNDALQILTIHKSVARFPVGSDACTARYHVSSADDPEFGLPLLQ